MGRGRPTTGGHQRPLARWDDSSGQSSHTRGVAPHWHGAGYHLHLVCSAGYSAGGSAGCGCRRTGWPLGRRHSRHGFGAPRNLLTAVVVFAAVVSNTASEMGYVVLVPLAAVVFHSVGRNPLVGLAAAFAGVSGGYSANILIGTVDPLLSGITTEAAQIIDAGYALGGARSTSGQLLLYVREHVFNHHRSTLVTNYIVEPKLGPTTHPADSVEDAAKDMGALSADEKRGLKLAGLTLAGMLAILAALTAKMAGFVTPPRMKPGSRFTLPRAVL